MALRALDLPPCLNSDYKRCASPVGTTDPDLIGNFLEAIALTLLQWVDRDADPIVHGARYVGKDLPERKGPLTKVHRFYHRISSFGTNRSTFLHWSSFFRYFARSL